MVPKAILLRQDKLMLLLTEYATVIFKKLEVLFSANISWIKWVNFTIHLIVFMTIKDWV